ncbi:MAG: ubiquinol-cytochrome c reductase iron-sulfur subunit [Thermoplasmatota archaeon]
MTDVPRREFLKGAAVFGATCALGAGMYVAGRSKPPIAQPILRLTENFEVELLTASTLHTLVGDSTGVYTAQWGTEGWHPVVVYVVDRAILEASTKLRGVDTAQFALALPGTDRLVLAYHGSCKHLGCTVGWDGALGGSKDVPDYDGDGVNDGRVLCPCHQAQYDIYDLGTHVPGTPAPEPLDVIKIAWDNGVLMGLQRIHQVHAHDADGK